MLFVAADQLRLLVDVMSGMKLFDSHGKAVRVDALAPSIEAVALNALSSLVSHAYGHHTAVFPDDIEIIDGRSGDKLLTPPSISQEN